MCILANLTLAGCAVSPADDRHPLSPSTSGLRDGGRNSYDDDDDDEVPATQRARDASADARARSGTSDSGLPDSSRPRDAAARVDADVATTVGVNTAAPPLIPNTPISAPIVDPSTSAGGNQVSDRVIADRAANRDVDDRESESSDERPSTSTSRSRDGVSTNPPREMPPTPGTRDRGGRSAVPQCRYSWDCPASACELTEYACCGDGACGCKGSLFGSCRARN